MIPDRFLARAFRQASNQFHHTGDDLHAAVIVRARGLIERGLRTVYLDMDGVMADFDGAFPAVFGLDHRSLADEVMWGHINAHPTFFRDLPPMVGAIDFYNSIRGLQPIMLTACPRTNYREVAAQKREWARHHLCPHITVLPVMGGRNKALFMHNPGDILIDDFGKNCEAWREAGGVAIKHEGDWTATMLMLGDALRSPL